MTEQERAARFAAIPVIAGTARLRDGDEWGATERIYTHIDGGPFTAEALGQIAEAVTARFHERVRAEWVDAARRVFAEHIEHQRECYDSALPLQTSERVAAKRAMDVLALVAERLGIPLDGAGQ